MTVDYGNYVLFLIVGNAMYLIVWQVDVSGFQPKPYALYLKPYIYAETLPRSKPRMCQELAFAILPVQASILNPNPKSPKT